MSRSSGETKMELILKASDIDFVIEHRFHPVRKWRFDFALVDWKIAIEVEGGVYAKGRHTRGSGFSQDARKYNAATVLGWRILRYTTAQVDFDAIHDIKKVQERISYERGEFKRELG